MAAQMAGRSVEKKAAWKVGKLAALSAESWVGLRVVWRAAKKAALLAVSSVDPKAE